MKNILIIDDEEKLRGLLGRIVKSEGFDVIEAPDLKSGFKKLEQIDIDVVLCDVKLPDGNGVDFLQKIKTNFPLTEVILLTAYGNISDGVQAMKNGAFDYIVKGDDNDKIIPLLYKAFEKVQLQKKVKQLEKLKGRAGVWLKTHTDIQNFKRLKAFVIGVSFGDQVKKQKWREVCKIRSEQLKGSSYHNLVKQLPSHFSLACIYLANKFGIAISTASEYKKLAHQHGFMDVRRNQIRIDSFMLTGEKNTIGRKGGIPAKYANQFRGAHPEYAKRVKIKDGYLYLDEADTAKPLMEFKRRHIKKAS